MKEADFLNALESISLIGKNMKQELESCLNLRNGSGYPNSLKFGTRKIAAHIEILILNVFTKFWAVSVWVVLKRKTIRNLLYASIVPIFQKIGMFFSI